MLNLNVRGETLYLANMQIYTACHRKHQSKSSLTWTSAIRGLLRVVTSGEVSVLPTLPHISSRKTASITSKKTLSHRRSASWPDLSGLSPGKTASVPTSERVRQRQLMAIINYVIRSEKCNFDTFQDVRWVRILITTHYNSIHTIINSQWLRV